MWLGSKFHDAPLEKIILVAIFNILTDNIKYGDDIFFILAENNLFQCGVRTCRALFQKKAETDRGKVSCFVSILCV